MIASLNDYIAASKQMAAFMKTATMTTVAATPFSTFALAGQPGAGVLAGTNTANGVVPISGDTGYPKLNAFAPGAKGYLSGVTFASSIQCRMALFDRLFVAGAYNFNSDVTLTSQPSFSTRIPDSDYRGTQIWIEAVTAFTGNLTIQVYYTNQDGVTGRTTGAFATGIAPIVGRAIQLPLQAGDTGVQKIERVVGTVSTVGTFNVMILRPLWEGVIRSSNDGDKHDMLKTGLPEVFATSALYTLIYPTSTSSGLPVANYEIASL